jgi:AraC family transcriptional regulator
MQTFASGNYLGNKVDTFSYNGIFASKAQYCSVENKGRHCHENSFFAFFLRGGNYEYRGSKEIKCSAGTLLFYRAGEPHCNKAYSNGCKIFHVEIENNWFNECGIKNWQIKADVINNLPFKNSFVNILNEFAIRDELSGPSIENLLIYLFNLLSRSSSDKNVIRTWCKKFNVIIKDCLNHDPSLANISKQLDMHPVTLSKAFPKYYQCGFGEYIRQLRIENSLPFLAKKNIPVSDVAYRAGFSDTSNFIRLFKKVKGVTPNVYRQLI